MQGFLFVQMQTYSNLVIISSTAVSDGIFQNGKPTTGKNIYIYIYKILSMYIVVAFLENSGYSKMMQK